MYTPVHILPDMDDSGLPDEEVFLDLQRSPSEVHMSDEEMRIYRRAKFVMLYVSLHVSILHDSFFNFFLYVLFLASFFLSLNMIINYEDVCHVKLKKKSL